MAARITEVLTAVAARLQEGWGDPPPAAVHVGLPPVWEDGKEPAGRQVTLYRAGQEDVGPGTRGEQWTDYRVAVQAAVKYDQPGDPPDSWVDEQVAWVEAEVWEKLGRAGSRQSRLAPVGGETAGVYTQAREWPDHYEADLLAEHGVFESTVVFTFRECRA